MTLVEIIEAHGEGKIADIRPYAEDIAAFVKVNAAFKQAKEAYCKVAGIEPNDKQTLSKRPTTATALWGEMMMCLEDMNDLAENEYEVHI